MAHILSIFRRRRAISHERLLAIIDRSKSTNQLELLRTYEDRNGVPTIKVRRYNAVLQLAEACFRQSHDWVTFFRQVLGVDGVVRKSFPTFEELTAFERSEQYEKIQKLLVKLREKRPAADTEGEPTHVITIRLPKSMHEALRHEAHDMRTSMNKLCISKLLQVIDGDLVPSGQTYPVAIALGSEVEAPGETGPPFDELTDESREERSPDTCKQEATDPLWRLPR